MKKRNIMEDVGKFFVLGFDSFYVPVSLKRLSEKYNLGGVILFRRNIESPDQLKTLTSGLKCLVTDIPLLIGIDQEGGKFQRLTPPKFKSYPPASELDKDSASDVGEAMGRELRQHGITIDFAPVLDVNTNPDNPIIGSRAFSSEPEKVAEIGKAFIEGLHKNGILACGKHFPGHGETDADSHVALPVVNLPEERLRNVEIYPFIEAVKAGLKCIMTAHVTYPALDMENPATFSKKILTDILREEYNYNGLIITDDMNMVGAQKKTDMPDACIKAFAAGCDLILICEKYDRHEEVINALGKAIQESEILQKRARESLERIQQILSKK